MQLVTDRLVLREMVEDDWRAIYEIERDPEAVRYQSFAARTEDDAREYVQGIVVEAHEVPRLVIDLAITERGRLIGRVGMKRSDTDPRVGYLWYVLAPHATRRGYATEAARALIDHGFAALRMHRIYAEVDPRNAASVGVLTRLGLRREAHFVHDTWIKGAWCDTYVYAVLAHEWRT